MTEAGRHELSCAACGAPLHEMKAMPVRRPETPRRAAPARAAPKPSRPKPAPCHRKRGRRMRKFSPMRMISKALDEVWDEIEDIFD